MARKKDEEEFDFLTPYLQRVGLEGGEKRKTVRKEEHFEISPKDIARDIVKVFRKEKKIVGIVLIEIVLTVLLILMIIGVLPFF